MALVCADTNFLYAVYDPGEPRHTEAFGLFFRLFEYPRNNALGLPWPILYETLDTRLSKRPESITRMNEHLTRLRLSNNLVFIDDGPFRIAETANLFAEARRGTNYRPLSLVDRIVRRVIGAHLPRIDVLVTLNIGDFVDVCASARCQIVSF